MNWVQFKDSVSHMCLAGTVVASCSLTQEVAGSNSFIVMTDVFVTEFAEFGGAFRKNSIEMNFKHLLFSLFATILYTSHLMNFRVIVAARPCVM